MTRRTLLAMFLLFFGIGVGIAWPDSIEGTWKLRLSLDTGGARTFILKLQMDGDQLTGSVLRDPWSETAIENTSYQDGELTFETVRERNDRESRSQYRGRFAADADTIEGTTELSWRGRTRTLNWVATRTTSEEVSQDLEVPPVAADVPLTVENYDVWREHILPTATELAWQEIPWLTTFKDGVLAANTEQKPLLLWTMNGHPLGCT